MTCVGGCFGSKYCLQSFLGLILVWQFVSLVHFNDHIVGRRNASSVVEWDCHEGNCPPPKQQGRQRQMKNQNLVRSSTRFTKKNNTTHGAAVLEDNNSYWTTRNGNNEQVIHILAPPGKLGVSIDDTYDNGPPVVYDVEDTSILAHRIRVGDKLVGFDDKDVRSMTAMDLSEKISSKSANPSRKLTIVRTVANADSTSGSSLDLEQTTNNNKYLDCQSIAQLEIVKLLGTGNQKIVYEVKLPWGEHAVAKRCHTLKCYRQNLIRKEANLFRGLFEQYGEGQAVKFFGECYRKYKDKDEIVTSSSDFTVGHTSVIELGNPLVDSWDHVMEMSCFASYLTSLDVRDLVQIARRYANYSESPILLAEYSVKAQKKNKTEYHNTDNVYPNQYITRTSSSSFGNNDKGLINHADMDMVYLCKDHYEEQYCTYEMVLEANCRIMRRLTKQELDCSDPLWDEQTETAQTHERINATRAVKRCEAQFQRKCKNRGQGLSRSNRKMCPEINAITPTQDDIRKECFPLNSNDWIENDVYSNNDAGITRKYLETLMEGPKNFLSLQDLFDQTICHRDSPLRNFAAPGDWYQRFLYLALHWRFHQPALEEYRSRKACDDFHIKSKNERPFYNFMEKHKIHHLDFECPGAKFVVIPTASTGFGNFLNTQASLSILLALNTNRIPIFSTKSFFPWQKRKGETDPWLLAPTECDRKDFQCYFLPLSPCTVTEADLERAPIYGSNRTEQMYLSKKLGLPPSLQDERIVVINPGLASKTIDTPSMRTMAHSIGSELLQDWKDSPLYFQEDDWRDMEMGHQMVKELFREDPIGLLRQVYVYMLRPNPHYRTILKEQMSALVPNPLAPSNTVGIAIRGSDKCLSESMCLSFDRYMELATNVALPLLSPPASAAASTYTDASAVDVNSDIDDTRPTLIMTTEDPKIFKESLVYQANASFPFRFLVNHRDNLQGSGYPKDFGPGQGRRTIVSSLMALQLHFHASKVYLNCCSNFHLVLDYLLQAQCGAQRHLHAYEYLQTSTPKDHQNKSTAAAAVSTCLGHESIPRRYRICCGWSKKQPVCGEIWKEYLMEMEAQNGLGLNEYGKVAVVGGASG